MTVLLRLLFALAALGLLWGPLRRIFRPSEPSSQPTESVDVPLRRNPQARSQGLAGAVALEEPDDDAPADCFPPRSSYIRASCPCICL